MEHVGLSMAMGAFLAGLLIADSAFRHQVIAETQPFRGLLLGLFFMSMGMSLDIGEFLRQPAVILALVVALVALKAVVIWPLARMFGLSSKDALTAALLLAQSGEFALVLFTVALGAGLLEQLLFQQLLLVVIFSMLVTPLLASWARKIKSAGEGAESTAAADPAGTEDVGPKPVLIIGFGRVGHKIGDILELAKVPFSAIDNKPNLVAREHAQGRSVFFGDAERPAVLKAMGAENARIAIIALDDHDVTEQLVATLRANFPKLAIFARGHNRARCEKLKSLGVDVVVSETLETSIELARVALVGVSTPDDDINLVIEGFRSTYHQQ